MPPGPAVGLGPVIGDPVDVGLVAIRVADDVGGPSDRVPDPVDQLLLPLEAGRDGDGELLPLLCDVPEVRLAVEAPVADQVDVLDPQLLQAVQDMVEHDRVGHAAGQLGVPQGGIRRVRAQKPEVYLHQVLVVAVVPPLHIGIVLAAAGYGGDVEQQRLLLGLPGDPEPEEGVAPVVGNGGEQLADPLGTQGVTIEAPVVQPVPCAAEGLALADAVPGKLEDAVGIIGTEGFLEDRPDADVPGHLVQDEVLSHQRCLGDKRCLGAGGFLPGLVVPVVYLGAVRTEASDALALVLAALLPAVPEGDVLIEVGHAVLLVGHLYDLRFGNAVVLHRYNYIYVVDDCQAESRYISMYL